MGAHRLRRPLSGTFVPIALLAVLVLLSWSASSDAYFVSRRQALQRRVAEEHAGVQKQYRIGVKHMPPMCFYDPTLPENQQFSGFYIDFWRAMNDDLLLNYSFHVYQNNLDVIEGLKNGKIDIGLGLSITWKRAMEVDFTQPIVDGSLRIMSKARTGVNVLELFMPFHWTLWVAILLIAVINGHIIWLVERDSNSYYFPKFYFSGIREGLWFSFMNLMMMDDAVVRSFPGKLVKFGSSFIGVILISIYTATVASVLTTGDFSNRITGPQDLVGYKVGTNYGSTASEYVANYGGMKMALYPSAADTFAALRAGKVTAIILDYPVLVYYSRILNDPGLSLVDAILEYDFVGLAMRQNSTLIPTLNGAIVGLTQGGFSTQLTDKWVGEPKRPPTQAYDFFDTVGLWIWMFFWIIAGVLAFVAKKYCVRKSYKHTSWYGRWGGDEKARQEEDAKDAAAAGRRRFLHFKSLPSTDSFLPYSEGEEETDVDATQTPNLNLSVNPDEEEIESALM